MDREYSTDGCDPQTKEYKVEFKYHVQPISHTTLILYLFSFSATREGEEDMDRETSKYVNEEYKK